MNGGEPVASGTRLPDGTRRYIEYGIRIRSGGNQAEVDWKPSARSARAAHRYYAERIRRRGIQSTVDLVQRHHYITPPAIVED